MGQSDQHGLMLFQRQLRLQGATAAVSFSTHRYSCFGAPPARGLIRQAPQVVGLFGCYRLSDWFRLSVGLFVGWSIALIGLMSLVWSLLLSSVLYVWAWGWSVWLVWSVYCCVCRHVGLGYDCRRSWRLSNWYHDICWLLFRFTLIGGKWKFDGWWLIANFSDIDNVYLF